MSFYDSTGRFVTRNDPAVCTCRARRRFQPGCGGNARQKAALRAAGHTLEVRDLLRCILNLSDEEQVPSLDYRRTFPLPSVMPQNMANVFNDATVIEFSTANDIPAVLDYDPAAV